MIYYSNYCTRCVGVYLQGGSVHNISASKSHAPIKSARNMQTHGWAPFVSTKQCIFPSIHKKGLIHAFLHFSAILYCSCHQFIYNYGFVLTVLRTYIHISCAYFRKKRTKSKLFLTVEKCEKDLTVAQILGYNRFYITFTRPLNTILTNQLQSLYTLLIYYPL
jgi:hypothetical protein